jgi:mRNA (guanine-N7-)-methyltransferase
LEFGNSIFKIRFERKDQYPIFGHRYWFQLEDAIDDCPEYLIHQPTLISIAKEYGLKLILLEPFHDFYEFEKRNGAELLDRMRVFNSKGSISRDEWEAIGIYCTFALEKV